MLFLITLRAQLFVREKLALTQLIRSLAGKKVIPLCSCLRFQQGQKLIGENPFLRINAVYINEHTRESRCVPPTQLVQ